MDNDWYWLDLSISGRSVIPGHQLLRFVVFLVGIFHGRYCIHSRDPVFEMEQIDLVTCLRFTQRLCDNMSQSIMR